MSRVLRETGRGLVVFVAALVPCSLLVLSLAEMTPPPSGPSPAPVILSLTHKEPMSAPASPETPTTAAEKPAEPDPSLPVLPAPPLLPGIKSVPTVPAPALEHLPALGTAPLPSPVKNPAVSEPAHVSDPAPPKPPAPTVTGPGPTPTTSRRPSVSAASPPTGRSAPTIDGYEWGEIDQSPSIVRRFPPRYPYRARRRGVTGTVVVRFLITCDGTVSSAKIMKAEPEGIFEDAVLACVRKWKFRPGRHRGKPVPTWAELPFRFKL